MKWKNSSWQDGRAVSYTHLDVYKRQGLTWDDMDISEEAIADNKAYVIINKQVERVSKDAIEAVSYTHLDVYKRQEKH